VPNVFPCPEPAELEQLAAGRRSSEEVERLAGHLEECQRCAATVDSLLASDSLVRNLAVRTAGLPAEEALVVAKLIRRLSELALLPAAVTETLTEPTTSEVPRPEIAQEHYDFLSPAEGPGELGRLGGYRVLKVLGAGGMGVVFEAEDPQLKRLVALKVMKPALAASDSARQRFLREAQATAALEHDHIVAIYQVGQDRGAPFLAMPLLKGETLEYRLRHLESAGCEPPVDSEPVRAKQGADAPRSPRQIALSETLRIGREMAAGLAAAHQRGLVHRDIKPANVWLEGTRGRVKLLDFGLARAQAGADGADTAQLTQEGGILGTPAYMSPEQAKGQPVDARSDLFSLGCVLYRLATGQPAFKGADSVSTLVAITTAKPKPPREHNRDLPASFSDLIMVLLAKDRDERPASAQAVVEAIEAIEGENREQGTGNRGGRRRTWMIAGAAALLLAGIVVIVRNRSGEEIARVQVPQGGSAETRENDDTKPSGGQSQETEGKGQATAEKIPPPTQVAEPLPLAEWFKGRTVLTVAQDGGGQFKSIQAALDALQPGQVIKVLDSGPYRETLYAQLPPNTGLVSDQQTVIEIGDPRPRGNNDYPGGGHALFNADGFRISGIVFGDEQADKLTAGQFIVTLLNPSGVVVERCWLRCRRKEPWRAALDVAWWGGETLAAPCFIRECLFDGELVVLSSDAQRRRPTIVVERNWFRKADLHRHIWIGRNPRAVVRHNVFDGILDRALWITNTTGTEGIEIYNNTIPSACLEAAENVETQKVTIFNNLLGSNTAFAGEATEELPRAIAGWQVGRNQYATVSDHGHFPKRPSDLFGEFGFISTDPSDPNYRRLRPESPTATSGVGGAWPSYIGALPPGPAPPEGDWFTRLRERWRPIEADTPVANATAVLPPVHVPEPPPLEEWLKGRTVLTVAQDGSGQFKTIQAALEALKPHQVVEVLDQGPYRERLKTGALPLDTGLISKRQAVVELSSAEQHDDFHAFGPFEGFRLSGLRFVGRASDRIQVFFQKVGGLIVEDCGFTATGPIDDLAFPCALWVEPRLGGQEPDLVVRGCLFDSAYLCLISLQAEDEATASFRVERNYFTHSFIGLGKEAIKNTLIRHNVFDGRKPAIDIQLKHVVGSLDFSNNTVWGAQNSFRGAETKLNYNIEGFAPRRGITIRNNITLYGPGLTENLQGMRTEFIKNWRIDHNAYTRFGSFPRFPGDILEEPQFLSTSEKHRDYLRITSDCPQATGGAGGDWPDYIGALPPGPAPAEGDWFTRLRERWQSAGTEIATVNPADIPPPVQIPEPPPLEEWLKGRTVLTVAQDGSGQFKTIQAALDALQSGEVVSVLDRGPYRERLVLDHGPPNTGLISQQGAVIELSEWKSLGKDERGDCHQGHVLWDIDGFRLHGFDFHFPEDVERGDRLHVLSRGELIIEECRVRNLPNETWNGHSVALVSHEADGRPHSFWVRGCAIEGYLEIHAYGKNEVTAVIEQNEFDSIHCDHHIHLHGDAWKQVVVRHNVFRGKAELDVLVNKGWKPSATLEVTNNTSMTITDLVVFQASAEHGHVTVRNNVHTSPRLIRAMKGADEDLAAAQRNWRIDHNIYPTASPVQSGMMDNVIPRSLADVPATPRFLSKNPANADYLRIATDSPLATAGAGGDWPNYVGALPPGPAPKEGDWFSRLREQWRSAEWKTATAKVADIPPPADMPEPPPLEEWLKDREVLTVSQDGSGRFKTIQAALDALQPGQAIKVLDAGPYRERLEKEELPADTGLVSEKMTVLELPAYHFHYKDADHEYYKGHYFRDVDGFRIAGFTFSFPAREKGPSFGLQTHRGGGFVLERCWLRSPVQAIVGYHAGGSSKLSCVRECRIDGMLHVGSLENDQAATLIARNLFFGEHGVAHVGIDSVYKYLGIRHNVFANPDKGLGLVPNRLGRLEINNNTFLGRNPVFFVRSVPSGEVVICNNLRLRAGLLALVGGAEEQRDEVVRDWHVGFNCYLRELAPDDWPDWPKEQLVPRFPNDILATPRFVSKVAGEPDYLRPAADDPIAHAGAGGAWPDFIGALPPGPAPTEGDWFTRLQGIARTLD